jgi:hypothetical protein
MTDVGHRLATANLLTINDFAVPPKGRGPRLDATVRGQRRWVRSELVDRAAHAERTTIEHMRVHHRRAYVRVPEQLLLHGPNVVIVLQRIISVQAGWSDAYSDAPG